LKVSYFIEVFKKLI